MLSPSSASLVLSIVTLVSGCSSDSDPSAANGGGTQQEQGGGRGGGTDNGGASESSAGAEDGGADMGESSADAGEGGADTSAGAGGSKASSGSPCSYVVSGGQSFPEGDAMYVCTVNSRVYQKSGKGKFNALIGAGFSTSAGDTSTFACNLDSSTAPQAGDTWTMSKDDHPGNCELAFSHDQKATLWHAASSPLMGEVSITFNKITVKNGMYTPEDIYYLYDLTISAKVKGLSEGAPDVTVSSTFVNMGLPLGA
ncbi:MAG: hypothetical protein WDO74_28730 [Pseudomonadota bacterium]